MGTTERHPEFRTTLRHILREVLKCRAWSTAPKTPGPAAEVSRRTSPGPPCLPQPSLVSLLPDFELDRFGIHRYSASTAESPASPQPHLRFTSNKSRLSLLPATRLSQLDICGLYSNYVAPPQRQVRYETIPESLADGASHLASISTLTHQPSIRSQSSTLKIRRSSQFIPSESQCTWETGPSSASMSTLRKARGFEDLRMKSSGFASANRSASQMDPKVFETATSRPSSYHSTRRNASIHSVMHFGSFCVLDTFASGCPVTATSEDLRYVFHVGDQFVLNVQECEGTSIDIVTGFGHDGEEVVHLVLFSPLISPRTGTSRFIVAALIDVTHFVREASQLPELDTIGDESASEDEVGTPASTPTHQQSSTRSYELLPDDLLRGCSITANRQYGLVTDVPLSPRRQKSTPTKTLHDSEDIWLALAREETLEKNRQHYNNLVSDKPLGCDSQSSLRSESTRASSSSTVVDDVLDEFMSSLQQLYSESFILARCPLDDQYYEICDVSPAVYASGEHVAGHLTHTAPNVVKAMSESLAAGTAFTIKVRWGGQGIDKRLYCVPLYGQNSIPWMCVLVDVHMPILW